MKDYPTEFQQKTLWSAITGLSIVGIGAIAAFFIWLATYVLGVLQPVLIPLAVAGIIAYLLEPIVSWLIKRGISRTRSVLLTYSGFLVALILLFLSIIPSAINQGVRLWEKREEISTTIVSKAANWKEKYGDHSIISQVANWFEGKSGQAWLKKQAENITQRAGGFVARSAAGIATFLGFLIGLVLIPIYLYYFLREGTKISENWSDYLPLKASKFKDEIVSTLQEINSYLIAFFRGQMLVSLIDGILVGLALSLFGLPYALLIGVFVALLGIIPFIGNLLCWIPAVLVSIAHFSIPDNQYAYIADKIWLYPLIVTGIFVIVQQLNSLFTAPKIVGNSVGLHPMTVIFSVFFWSLLIGGLLGALLAVPLSASIKVLFRRYIWEKKLNKESLPAL